MIALDASAPSRPLLRYFGGKWRMAGRIIEHMPKHEIYVEPFGGGASVLFNKPRSYAEVYNDLDGEIVNLFCVVRDYGAELIRRCELTPYARPVFDESFRAADDPIEQARRTLVRSFMGFGGNLTRPNRDQTPQRTGFRNYSGLNRGSTPARNWREFPAGLPALIERLRGVIIEQRDALLLIPEHDSDQTLFYVDPPYVHSTRGATSGGSIRGYRFEMTDDQHRALAAQLRALAGMVMLSGYHSELYDELFGDWARVEFPALADGARKRTEVLWFNPAADEARKELMLL
jgi:DNA adenine methylase